MAETINSMTLYLAEGKFPDLYPWSLVLEEGFSRLYRGELTVLSEKKHALAEFSGLLDRGISLSLSQQFGNGVKRTRYLHGILTGARCAGVFSDGKKKDSYSYVLTIEPELARLAFTRLSASYYRMNPPDIFEAVVNKHGLSVRIEDRYSSRGGYGAALLFEQADASDLDFIGGLAALYGISFAFVHPPSPAAALGTAALYVSDGKTFPRTELTYSDKRKDPDPEVFDFLSAADTVGRMDTWTMSQAIGFDGFALDASYPNAAYGSDAWKWGDTNQGSRHIRQRRLFHSYERETDAGEVDRDIERILEAGRLSAAQDKDRWTAGTANLALRPGLILELRHFYGRNDPEVITALATGIVLRHQARWPVNLAGWTEDAGGELTEVRGTCVDWGSGAERRFCPQWQASAGVTEI
jgi:hypothetical protein